MGDLTRILHALEQGDDQAAEELLPLVYEELRQMASSKMARERAGHTLQPTALVNEAWLRLARSGGTEFKGKAHFFAVAAEAMRRILIETARRKRTQKRGDGAPHEAFDDVEVPDGIVSDEVLAVHESLDQLAREDPEAAHLVKLRYFVGMTMEEAALALAIPLRRAERLWAFSRAWLRRQIERDRN